MAGIARPVRSICLAMVIACAALVALPQTCFACSCALPLPTPAQASDRAVAVFRGTVTNFENKRGGRTTFRVSTVWKGLVTSEMIIFGGSDNFSCSYRFQQGTEYVVYPAALALAPPDCGARLRRRGCLRDYPRRAGHRREPRRLPGADPAR